jgi:hypothetical protein
LGTAGLLSAQTSVASSVQSLKGMSLNGSTGLYTLPTARIGWERTADVALDLGYKLAVNEGDLNHLASANVSLFKWAEIATTVDIQPTGYYWRDNEAPDLLFSTKVQIPLKMEKSALAIGGNVQAINFANRDPWVESRTAGQVFVALSFDGTFFSWPAETTVLLGKSFQKHWPGGNLDFGMGFDMTVMPEHLNNVVHWVTDVSNFSYSMDPWSVNAGSRGCVNTGLRIDLSRIPALNKFKFAIDIAGTDLFDEGRALLVSAVFGMKFI